MTTMTTMTSIMIRTRTRVHTRTNEGKHPREGGRSDSADSVLLLLLLRGEVSNRPPARFHRYPLNGTGGRRRRDSTGSWTRHTRSSDRLITGVAPRLMDGRSTDRTNRLYIFPLLLSALLFSPKLSKNVPFFEARKLVLVRFLSFNFVQRYELASNRRMTSLFPFFLPSFLRRIDLTISIKRSLFLSFPSSLPSSLSFSLFYRKKKLRRARARGIGTRDDE